MAIFQRPASRLDFQDLFAVVDPDNLISETDEGNNTLSIRVGGPDLTLSLRTAVAEPDGSARIVVEIRNAGTMKSGEAQVRVSPAEAPASVLTTAEVPPLDLTEAAEISLNLPPRSVRAEQSHFEVTITSLDDLDTENNKVLVAIQPSDIQIKTVDKPQILPQGGQFDRPTSATIICTTEGALIRYTTNGKDPTEDDPVIPSGASVPITSSMTLKAKAWKSAWVESAVAVATFTVGSPQEP